MRNNTLFYENMKRLNSIKLKETISELLANGTIHEDMLKCEAGNKREFITKCIKPLRLHCVKEPFVLYNIEEEIIPE